MVNCLLTNNATNAVQTTSTTATIMMESCALYNNTNSGVSSFQITNGITLTADPYVAVGSNDYRLNNQAGGGAACRAAGFPAAINSFDTGLNVGAFSPKVGTIGVASVS
jgi:hypothetical protein